MAIEDLAQNLNLILLGVCTIFVFFMQAGFAMLESGLVRSKNTVNVLMKNYIDVGVGTLTFWLVGYGLMYGASEGGWFGTSHFTFSGDGSESMFFIFQAMFAATAVTIVSGAVAERIRYLAYILVSIFICGIIYPVYGHWAWGGLGNAINPNTWTETQGWLEAQGFKDFAGSAVVHAVGGWCALAGVIVLGSRMGRFTTDDNESKTSNFIYGHNLPIVALGAFILWAGWFAFNMGSVGEVNETVGTVLMNTHLAGAAGCLGMIVFLILMGQPIAFPVTINGGLAGLVASCAGADVFAPGMAIITGFVAAIVAQSANMALERFRLDDAVGAVGVHGFAGAWGAIAAGLLAPDTFLQLAQLKIQLIGVVLSFVWAFPVAFIAFKIISVVMPLRVSTREERRGLDFAEHNEIGYPEFMTAVTHQGAK